MSAVCKDQFSKHKEKYLEMYVINYNAKLISTFVSFFLFLVVDPSCKQCNECQYK